MSRFSDLRGTEIVLGCNIALGELGVGAEFFENMVNNLPVGVYSLVMGSGKKMPDFMFANKKFFYLTGLNEADVRADFFQAFDCVHPADYERIVKKNIYSFTNKGVLREECRLIVDGQIRWVFVEATPRQLSSDIWIWDGVIKDITDQKIGEDALRRARRRLMEAKTERVRILAREELLKDIHDGFGNTLAIGKLRLRNKKATPSEALEVVEDCLVDLRILMDTLESEGDSLFIVLSSVVDRSKCRAKGLGLELTFDLDGARSIYLAPRQMLQVGRIVQEAVSNAIRHAEAQAIHVSVNTGTVPNTGRIEITDDGKGFDSHSNSKGRGLKNMRQRAQLEEWKLEFSSLEGGKGTRVSLEIGALVSHKEPEESFRSGVTL